MPSLSPIELAGGVVFGTVGDAPVLPTPVPGETAQTALERACLPALRRPPCLVSFSGGRDSALVLAAAARAARREGLPAPVPATNRFPQAGHSDESDWQELVVRHLGLCDWVRLELTDELDLVGPVATRALARHGLLWPFNAHFHAPLLEVASGGSLLTGIGGDEVLGDSRWARATAVLSGLERPCARDLPRLALLASPVPVRRAVLARRAPAPFPWLRPAAAREFACRWAAEQACEPARFGARLALLQARRTLRVGLRSLDLLAADAGAAIAHPLVSPAFCAALVAQAGWRGWEDRTLAMRTLFSDLLPARLLARATKARFEGAFWGPHSRALAACWQGEGADPAVVDRRALRTIWARPEPDAHTYLLLQAAWLKRSELDHLPVPGAPIAA